MPSGGKRPGAGRKPKPTRVEFKVDPCIQTMGPALDWDTLGDTLVVKINRMNDKDPNDWTDQEIRVYPLLIKTLEFFKSKAATKVESKVETVPEIDLDELLVSKGDDYPESPRIARRALGR